MPVEMTDEEIRKKALGRVRARKSFFIHLSVYLAVNAFLWIIWFVNSGAAMGTAGWGMHGAPVWPIFPTLGWGIAIVIHGVSVFAFHGDWEEREVEKEIAKMKKPSS